MHCFVPRARLRTRGTPSHMISVSALAHRPRSGERENPAITPPSGPAWPGSPRPSAVARPPRRHTATRRPGRPGEFSRADLGTGSVSPSRPDEPEPHPVVQLDDVRPNLPAVHPDLLRSAHDVPPKVYA